MPFDRYNRDISYLRISLTDACNLRCVYCMPEKMTFRPRDELLSDAELHRLIGLFAAVGFRKIRFTGGEPTLRPALVEFVAHAARTPGIETIGLTTNGILLADLAGPLCAAGLRSVNISLDTLDPDKFKQITRWGELGKVLAGLDAAARVGLRVKLNAVVSRGTNGREDVIALARYTIDQPWQVRFIEQMPFGNNEQFQHKSIVTEDELRAVLTEAYGPLELVNNGRLDGEARLYRIAGAAGCLGFISPVSKPFCADCTRLRLTAEGVLRLCLLRDNEMDLRPLLRGGADDATLTERIRAAVLDKPWGHGLEENIISTRGMSEIGG
jgi:cyclic pyranopterin phosphate synthase